MDYTEEQIKHIEQDEQDWREMECLEREVKQRIEKINFFKFKILELEKSIEDEEYNVRWDTLRLEELGVSKEKIKSLITQIKIIKN